jgi:hypothetical protein
MMKYKVITLFLVVVLGLVVLAMTGKKDEEKAHVVHGTDYDVIVIGGEPEGVAAAVSAARNGAHVLFVEHRDGLGGLITYGMLNYLDLPQNANGDLTSKGIFEEWWKLVGGSSVTTVDIEESKQAFLQLVENEPNINLMLNTEVTQINKNGKNIESIVLSDGKTYTGKQFIDTTADAEFAIDAGVSYTTGQHDFGVDSKMAVTLMIHLKDVDWAKVKKAGKDGILGGAEVTERAAWGFPEVLHTYDEQEENTQVRGLNIGRTKNEEVFINALQIFYVDGLDEAQKAAAIEEGTRESEAFLVWLQQNLPGFENATFASIPTELYVRETTHINALYRLTIADVWESTDKYDVIAYGSYPVDVQATKKGNYGNVLTPANQYAIPLRSLLPLEIDNLQVASKASGYDSLAAGSARIIPTGMSVAEAAGIVAIYAIDQDATLKAIPDDSKAIESIQKTLRSQGAYLSALPKSYKFPYEDDAIYPSLKILYSYELISGGYKNDFGLEKTVSELTFNRLLKNAYSRLMPDAFVQLESTFTQFEKQLSGEVPLTATSLNKILSTIKGETTNYTFTNEQLTARDVYPIIADEIAPYVADYKINNEDY